MPMISVKDNKNNRWKRNVKKQQQQQQQQTSKDRKSKGGQKLKCKGES